MPKNVWVDMVSHEWMNDARGWDFSINGMFDRRPDHFLLQPLWARANHIGREGGQFITHQYFDATFKELSVSDGSERTYHL